MCRSNASWQYFKASLCAVAICCLALALRIAIVACAGALGLFLLGLGGEETVQGRLGMIAGVGKGSRFARRGRAQRRIEQADLGLRLIGPGRGGHDVELLPRPVDLLGPQSALLGRCGRQRLQIGQRRLAAEKTDGQIDLAGSRPLAGRAADDRPPATAGRCPALALYFFTSGRSAVSRACTAALPRKRVEIGRIIGQAEQLLEDGEGLFALAEVLPTQAAAQSGVESGQPVALLIVDRVEAIAGVLQGGRPLAGCRPGRSAPFHTAPTPGPGGPAIAGGGSGRGLRSA